MLIDDLRIRPAIVADAGAIAAFQTSAWKEAYEGLIPEAHLQESETEKREVR